MVHYVYCPLCKSGLISPALSVKDHTVSSKIFEINKCGNCGGMFTQDVPSQEEIGIYYASEKYISHTDTQKGFINKLYHRIRKRTLNGKWALIDNETNMKVGNILDIGCGTGAFLNVMKNKGWKITGLEPDETARKNAVQLYGISPLSSPELFNLQQEEYDAVTMWHVLEHVHQLQKYLEQIKKILTKNGKAFIAVPNYTSYDAGYYKEFWAAYDVPRHLYHFSPESMKKLVESNGMKLEKMKPMWFDSFYVSMLSEQYKNGKSNNIKAFITGLISNWKTIFNHSKCSSLIYIISKN
ncbi:MAG: class I SAM-dependent methyltransferase [Ferruginibacter sp.]